MSAHRDKINGEKARILKRQLRQRDGDFCCWCDEVMLFDVPGDNPLAASLEHLVSFSDLSNEGKSVRNKAILTLSHRQCNNLVGNRNYLVSLERAKRAVFIRRMNEFLESGRLRLG